MKLRIVLIVFFSVFLMGCDQNSSEQLKINYLSAGEVALEDDVDINSLVTPPDLTREGYAFKGWYSDEDYKELFDFSQPLNESITLYAKWEPMSYTLRFYFTEDDSIDVLVEHGDNINDALLEIDSSLSEYNLSYYQDKQKESLIDENMTIDSDMDIYIEMNDLKILNLHHIDTLSIQQYFEDIILTDDGYLYLQAINIFRKYNVDMRANDIIWIELNSFFDLAVNEKVVEILYNQNSYLVFRTNADRVILSNFMMTREMFQSEYSKDLSQSESLDYIELNSYIGLSDNDEITSVISHEYQTIVSTKEGEVYFWGQFELEDKTFNISEPINLTNDFSLQADEYFLTFDRHLFDSGIDIFYKTNMGRYFILNEFIDLMDVEVEPSTTMYTDISSVFEDSEDIIYFATNTQDLSGEYVVVYMNGNIKGFIDDEEVDSWLPLEEDDTIVQIKGGELLTSSGRIYQLISTESMKDITPESLNEDEMIIEMYTVDQRDIFVSNQGRMFLLNNNYDMTEDMNALDLSIDDLAWSGSEYYFIKDGVHYQLDSEGITKQTYYGMIPSYIVFNSLEYFELEDYETGPFYQVGWFNKQFDSFAYLNPIESMSSVYPILTNPPKVSFNIEIDDNLHIKEFYLGERVTVKDINQYLYSIGLDYFMFNGVNLGDSFVVDETMEGETIVTITYEKERIPVTYHYMNEDGQELATKTMDIFIDSIFRDFAYDYKDLLSGYRLVEVYLDAEMTIILDHDASVTEPIDVYVLLAKRNVSID